MINSVTVTNYLNESVALELGFPEKSGFLIQEIAGLSPSKADINMTDLSTGDGSVYNSARINRRNIVFTIRLLENPTIEITRQNTYKYFPIKKRVKLLIESDTRTCEIYGYVESNDPNIFSKEETTQISIVCPNPYFYSQGTTITIFSGLNPEFEFPFSNESLSENLLVMGSILTNAEQTIYYTGDAEIGVFISIHALGDVDMLTIYNSGTQEVMKIDTDRLATLTGFGIIMGDDIFISTIKGQKSITLFRDGTYTNILNCLDKNVDWFQLARGDNVFAFSAESGGTNLQFRVENQTVYEGV